MKCNRCGAENPENAAKCSVCLAAIKTAAQTPQDRFKRTPEFHTRAEVMIPPSKSQLPIAAGGILAINAILALTGLLIANVYISEFTTVDPDAVTPVNLVFGGIALFVLVGGILAMLRRGWGIAMIASIVSFFLVLAFGWMCVIVAAMLSIASLVLLILSRREFAGHRHTD